MPRPPNPFSDAAAWLVMALVLVALWIAVTGWPLRLDVVSGAG